MTDKGTLFLVPTPIGNLSDMTFRAVTILKEVDLIACEDTRTSSVLLTKYDITTPRTSFHLHNEHRKTPVLIEKLNTGTSIALITDAGSPGISDPGFLLVRAGVAAGIRIESLPGPSAVIPALTASGLPADRFVFEGFLPSKKGRQKKLQALASEDRTMIFFESPHRLHKLLQQMADVFGPEREAVVCREISKKFESYYRGSLAELNEWASGRDRVKGEIVVVLAGIGYAAPQSSDELPPTSQN